MFQEGIVSSEGESLSPTPDPNQVRVNPQGNQNSRHLLKADEWQGRKGYNHPMTTPGVGGARLCSEWVVAV